MHRIAMLLLLAVSCASAADAPATSDEQDARTTLYRIRRAGLVPLSRAGVDASLQGLRGRTEVLIQSVNDNPVEDVDWKSTNGQCIAYFGETTGRQPSRYGQVLLNCNWRDRKRAVESLTQWLDSFVPACGSKLRCLRGSGNIGVECEVQPKDRTVRLSGVFKIDEYWNASIDFDDGPPRGFVVW